jgi:2-desacetyl-2-hydroxyethyl bacteriochlorophyllide A dehydrogenase
MRAFVIEAPGYGVVRDVPAPQPGRGQVVVRVERAGICGTDVELLTGTMPYLHDGSAHYPLRPGHEWSGRVAEVGPGVDAGLRGKHVTGDTMIGCAVCPRCRGGRHHLCADRYEIGIRRGWPGALAEKLLVPATALHVLPDAMDPEVAAFVEPAGTAWRAADAAAGSRVCVWGPGTIGLLTLLFCRAGGASVDVVGPDPASRELALRLGAHACYHPDDAPAGGYDAVVDASNGPDVPVRALDQVDPGGRVVLVGVAGAPSLVDTRVAVLRDLTIVGLLAASLGLDQAISALARGAVRPEPLIARVVGLADLAAVLRGDVRPAASGAPKVHVIP